MSVARAAAASSSVPVIFSPQPLHDRRAMDGGVSGTGIHADLAAGFLTVTQDDHVGHPASLGGPNLIGNTLTRFVDVSPVPCTEYPIFSRVGIIFL